MSLTADRNTPRITGDMHILAMAAATKIFAGAIVCRDAAGRAVAGATALGLHGVGIAQEQVDNSAGGAGDLDVRVRSGVYRVDNSAGGDEITVAHVGLVAYVVDDHTVAATDGSSTRSPAGMIVGVDAQGVWVDFCEDDLAAFRALDKRYVQITRSPARARASASARSRGPRAARG